MTLPEAIKVMEDFRIPDPGEDFEDIDKAILLSIEALKRELWNRQYRPCLIAGTLPGETEE